MSKINSANAEGKFNTIEDALEDIKNGKMVIVIDDEDRENEGDIIMAAELITPEDVNFITREARGMLCAPITQDRARELNLDYMVDENTALHETPFTVTVDYKFGTTTGISAFDRAKTIRALVDEKSKAEYFARPGHIFPLIGKKGAVLKRAGHTEAAIDLARLAGLKPAGVLCEIMHEDGSMARVPELMDFSKKHDMKIITIADLIEYRRKREKLVKCKVVVDLPSEHGDFKLHLYENLLEPSDNSIALVKGDVHSDEPVLVRVHSECLTGDVFGSKRCDCGDQLASAMQMVEEEGRGVVLYMRQEGRGIGLVNKLLAYGLQEEGKDTVEANEELGFKPDLRDYGIGAQILKDLGLQKIKLLTNNPLKIIGLEGYDLEIVERVPIEVSPNEVNENYMRTKKEKMGHLFNIDKKNLQEI
ncbi:MAG: bifunctional 3,4-dihydroxy-2-butanone-4-phosphate synthase/GTP cyclohydrolase II [Ignavibacteriae bacterium]|nr:bifunctional 3,4-dihydroxy-2-butanone-4-phosphate synthase/GTP cyclohydrolase II [Ignavibacteriota bacterium]NOG97044.1 bifunctional 3,4-dihydroxy-2-butanone-4-phosphate synthase/GTP cyclohydrolase II [Ignavibacteriota bacterium]